jgi:hypothetical protein
MFTTFNYLVPGKHFLLPFFQSKDKMFPSLLKENPAFLFMISEWSSISVSHPVGCSLHQDFITRMPVLEGYSI